MNPHLNGKRRQGSGDYFFVSLHKMKVSFELLEERGRKKAYLMDELPRSQDRALEALTFSQFLAR